MEWRFVSVDTKARKRAASTHLLRWVHPSGRGQGFFAPGAHAPCDGLDSPAQPSSENDRTPAFETTRPTETRGSGARSARSRPTERAANRGPPPRQTRGYPLAPQPGQRLPALQHERLFSLSHQRRIRPGRPIRTRCKESMRSAPQQAGGSTFGDGGTGRFPSSIPLEGIEPRAPR